MKRERKTAISIALASLILVFVFFVPVVPTAHFRSCDPQGCNQVTQYNSVSFFGFCQGMVYSYSIGYEWQICTYA
jgi:hypothetical protein